MRPKREGLYVPGLEPKKGKRLSLNLERPNVTASASDDDDDNNNNNNNNNNVTCSSISNRCDVNVVVMKGLDYTTNLPIQAG